MTRMSLTSQAREDGRKDRLQASWSIMPCFEYCSLLHGTRKPNEGADGG